MTTTTKPQSIKIMNEVTYNAEDIYNYDRNFFIGCTRTRLIVEKKKLQENDYFFAYQKKGKWTISSANYPRAKLFLREEYVVKNVPKMMDEVKKELYKYEEAPSILELENEEKFKDKNGNVIEIEVRGERKHNNCFFRVKDVSIGFDMPSLQTTINGDNQTYIKNIDYKQFNVIIKSSLNETTRKVYLFMTYEGIIKLLYISRNQNAQFFRDWATEKLFTIQMGEPEQKDELGASLIGVNAMTIKNVFRTNTSKTPCVYLYLIGKASVLLEGEYHENDLLCKYGCTDDLPRRAGEHEKTFGKEFGVKIELLCFSIIEAQHIFSAEKNITQYLKCNLVEYNKMRELVIINQKDLSQIKEYYTMVQTNYIGRYEEMYKQIVALEKEVLGLNSKILLKDKDFELEQEKHKNDLKDKDIELRDKDIELRDKDIELRDKDIELRDKDIELLHYRLKLLECKI